MSIRRRKWKGQDTYEVRVYAGIDPGSGKERRITQTFKSLKEAKGAEADLLRQVRDSHHAPPTQQTVAEFLADWLENSARPNTKRRTFARYEQIVRLHLVPVLGQARLARLSAHDVASLLARQGVRVAPRTRLHVYRALHSALAVGVRWGLIPRNVCDAVDPPRVDEAPLAVLEPGHVAALLRAARGDRLFPFYLTAVQTGMRMGELCGLRWRDLNLNTAVAVVAQTLDKPGLQPVFGTPKSRRPRQVPLTGGVVEALKELLAAQKGERAFYAREYTDHGLVFCQANGRPLDPHSIARWHWPRLRRAARLPDGVRFHDLRHTFISRALQAGANPRAVSEIAGHHDAGFTLKRYAHVGLNDTREAVDQLEAYLRRRQDPMPEHHPEAGPPH